MDADIRQSFRLHARPLRIIEIRAAVDLTVDGIGAVFPPLLRPTDLLADLRDDTAHVLPAVVRERRERDACRDPALRRRRSLKSLLSALTSSGHHH